jgi:hypothetical protein
MSASLGMKLGISAASLAISGALAWAFLESGELQSGDTVAVRDGSGSLDRIYAQRHAEALDLPPPILPPDRKGPPPLPRDPIPLEVAKLFWPDLDRHDRIFDPLVYKRRKPLVEFFAGFAEHPDRGFRIRMNSSGLRGDVDVLEERPDVRVVVIGDSHVFGMASLNQIMTSRMQVLFDESDPSRSVEVINASMGGYNVYNYVGGSEYFGREFKPDYYVAIVMGGNDFSGALSVYRYYKRLDKPVHVPIQAGKIAKKFTELGGFGGIGPQEINQAIFLSNNPGDVGRIKRMMVESTFEMLKQCERFGVKLLCVYLPPPLQGQPRFNRALRERVLATSGLTSEEIERSDEIADHWIEYMRRTGIEYIDLRPVFRSHEEPLYWESDHHLNVPGHDLAGRVLHAALEGILGKGRR